VDADPVLWTVESLDDGAWRPVGASTEIVWPRDTAHNCELHPYLPHPTPAARNRTVAVVHWTMIVCPTVTIMGLLLRERHTTMFFMVNFFLNVSIRLLARWLLFDGIALRVFLWRVFFQSPLPMVVVLGLLIPYFRGLALAQSRGLVLGDKGRYDAVWAAILAREGSVETAAAIRDQLAALAKRVSTSVPRQLNRSPIAPPPPTMSRGGGGGSLSGGGGGDGVGPGQASTWVSARRSFLGLSSESLGAPGSIDPARPADCLWQLFTQAACLHPFLIAKVRVWAAASGGAFFRRAGGGGKKGTAAALVKAAELQDGGDMARAEWARLKSEKRAIEKMVRSYGEVSCLDLFYTWFVPGLHTQFTHVFLIQ
jgi:hypothetical protein